MGSQLDLDDVAVSSDLLPPAGTLRTLPERVLGVVQAYASAVQAYDLRAEVARLQAEVDSLDTELAARDWVIGQMELKDREQEAEIERLLSIISDIKDWDCDVRGGFLSIPLGLRRRMQEAIDAHHKQQEPGND